MHWHCAIARDVMIRAQISTCPPLPQDRIVCAVPMQLFERAAALVRLVKTTYTAAV